MATSKRHGYNLIEVLAVITIIALLASVAVPNILEVFSKRRYRTVAQTAVAYIAAAQASARETGRPCGVRIEPFGDGKVCIIMKRIDSPPSFSGRTDTARAVVRSSGGIQAVIESIPGIPKVGDLIRFNSAGAYYTVTGFNDDGYVELSVGGIDDAGEAEDLPTPWANGWSAPLQFTIYRQPDISSEMPYFFPKNTAIDLENSKMEGSGHDILFNPNGTVFYPDNGNSLVGTHEIVLLVRDMVSAQVEERIEGTAYQVRINPRTGRIYTNAYMAPAEEEDPALPSSGE